MADLHIIPHQHLVQRSDREQLNKHKSAIIWFTGLSGSGKSTLSHSLELEFHKMGFRTYVLDGDNIRTGLNKDLTFSDNDRKENIRRIGEVAKLMMDAGTIVITAFISPFREDRQLVRDLVVAGDFFEIFVNCPLEVCEQRDVKGLYQKARAGVIKDFTGIHSSFEEPANPEFEVKTAEEPLSDSIEKLLKYFKHKLQKD